MVVTVTMTGWDFGAPQWICSASLSDIHALHVRKVNGEPVSFDDPPGFVVPRITLRDRAAEWWARGRIHRAIWRHQNLPRVRLMGHCESEGDPWPDREGWVLSFGWRGYLLELSFVRPSDDDLPF